MSDLTQEEMDEVTNQVRDKLGLRDPGGRRFVPGDTLTSIQPAGVDEPFKSLGEQLKAIASADAPGGRIDNRLYKAATGLGEEIPSAGGYLLQEQFVNQLLVRVYETGILASKCWHIIVGPNANSVTIPGVDETSRATGSRWGGVRAYWGGEAPSTTATTPKFRRIHLVLEKLRALCYATDELLQDATALESIIAQAFTEEMGFQIDLAIINGSGAGQPLGVLQANCLVSQAAETGQQATTIMAENIIKMWSRMWAKSRPKAVWLINQDIEPQLYTMSLAVGTGGIPVYMPAGGLSGQPYGTLMARPVIPIEQCSTLGTVGDIILADFSQYVIVDKGGLQAARSIEVRFLYDETVFRFVYRVNGQPTWQSALTPYTGSSNTLGPFVALATRS